MPPSNLNTPRGELRISVIAGIAQARLPEEEVRDKAGIRAKGSGTKEFNPPSDLGARGWLGLDFIESVITPSGEAFLISSFSSLPLGILFNR